jgi:hypothetical protein
MPCAHIALALTILFVSALGWLAYELVTAPFGYEDSEGFHEGKPGDDVPDSYEAVMARRVLNCPVTTEERD